MNNKKIILIFLIGFLCGLYPVLPHWVLEYISYVLIVFKLYNYLKKLIK